MDILAENNALHNLGLCMNKRCKDTEQVDDFIQLCIQMIFYNKISLSELVPDYVLGISSGIINFLTDKIQGVNIDYQNIYSPDSGLFIRIERI
jgi:hypothetical protein